METLFAILIGLLVAAGVFLMLSRTIVRVVLGLTFIAYGVNLAILTVAGLRQDSPPLLTLEGPYVDPLPQALVLTAIVIGFGTTALLLTVALRAYQVAGHDDVAAFGDNLARDPDAPDGQHADPEHLSPDLPEMDHAAETAAHLAELERLRRITR
ncbi:Na+/H+ antiporter subunit C [Deinococcus humi]|uniref:Multicomponent Na+:H+ antiporter subunit C n=1 Tax=Deinococcus humi TaxID=662880 RepID=A0A7W8NI34_9DEIO|nr:Na+/H+ antiporter subunit C [Deinococcus humi]MBB5365413.1 multicomponent Na+:H+ antiporter subunit C [Deinococcus humi]GGO28022.1 cation transporter [Deinococcus humi]